ncbi:MAG: ABC transporter ATP-binding protein, partial [Pseudomonadota bacterium]
MMSVTDAETAGAVPQPSFLRTLRFAAAHWLRRPTQLFVLTIFMVAATLCDVLLPVAAGNLVDALGRGASAPGAADDAQRALLFFVALAFCYFAFRNASLRMWVTFAARNMEEIVAEAFAKVQRFSADWHANAFGGSTVRKLTRGMWAYDQLSDALFIGLLPPALVVI